METASILDYAAKKSFEIAYAICRVCAPFKNDPIAAYLQSEALSVMRSIGNAVSFDENILQSASYDKSITSNAANPVIPLNGITGAIGKSALSHLKSLFYGVQLAMVSGHISSLNGNAIIDEIHDFQKNIQIISGRKGEGADIDIRGVFTKPDESIRRDIEVTESEFSRGRAPVEKKETENKEGGNPLVRKDVFEKNKAENMPVKEVRISADIISQPRAGVSGGGYVAEKPEESGLKRVLSPVGDSIFNRTNPARGNSSNNNANPVRGSASNGANGKRQHEILERIRQTANCRMKDLQDEFGSVSERTIRYDLQYLIEGGLIERVGGGGPHSFYRARTVAPLASNPQNEIQVLGGDLVT